MAPRYGKVLYIHDVLFRGIAKYLVSEFSNLFSDPLNTPDWIPDTICAQSVIVAEAYISLAQLTLTNFVPVEITMLCFYWQFAVELRNASCSSIEV